MLAWVGLCRDPENRFYNNKANFRALIGRGLFYISRPKNVMSKRELFCQDPLARFEKIAGFQNVSTHNLENTSNVSAKVASSGYNLLINYFSRRIPHSKKDFNDINFLAFYWKCTFLTPFFFSRCIHKVCSYEEVPGYIRATFAPGLGRMYYRVSIQAANCVK